MLQNLELFYNGVGCGCGNFWEQIFHVTLKFFSKFFKHRAYFRIKNILEPKVGCCYLFSKQIIVKFIVQGCF